MSVIALIAYLLFATAPVSSQNPGGVSCCVDLSTPSCATAYSYCLNTTLASGASCQMLLCRPSISPTQYPRRTQTQTPSSASSASYTVSVTYPSNTHTRTVFSMQSSSTATAGSRMAPTAAAISGPASTSSSASATNSGTLSPSPASAVVRGAQPAQNEAVSTNVVAVVAVSACVLMIVGFGGYIIMKKWSSTIQKNIVSNNTPDVKTENPIHEYKDKYVDDRVVFKPIPRSFTV